MSYTYRFEIFPKDELLKKETTHELNLKNWFFKYLSVEMENIFEVKYFVVESVNEINNFNEYAHDVFIDSVVERLISSLHVNDETKNILLKRKFNLNDKTNLIDISFKAGVTDNSAHAAVDALKIHPKLKNEQFEVASGTMYFVETKKNYSKSELVEIFYEKCANNLLHKIEVGSINDIVENKRFSKPKIVKVKVEESKTHEINLNVNIEQLLKINNENCWALSVDELNYIKSYYQELKRNPTDLEMEVIAQSWSEHCKHKIFASHIDYKEENLPDGMKKLGNFKVDSLFKTFIRGSTLKIKEDRKLPWLVSIFHDNAGIVRFDDKVDVCIKVETHNSPSALDPYGGALTGILGVNRDILGCGQGAKPIANTNVFCLAEDSFFKTQKINIPSKLKNPDRITEGVHLGVQDGGNKSGIPTVNGAFSFDHDFVGKPLVFCGTIGVLPQSENNLLTSEKRQKPGDYIVMSGGRIGKDGIHGATFSSMELNENSPSSVVQIGDPITQKKLTDFLIEARTKNLFTSVTDNGAGGLSSSIGEMAQLTNGAIIDLDLAPTKYPGLTPFELMVSESQERMTFSVSKEKINDFLTLSKKRNVESTVIGEFTDKGNLLVRYKKEIVGDIDLHFLHESLLPMKLNANISKTDFENSKNTHWIKSEIKKEKIKLDDYKNLLLKLLSSPNIRSHEHLVRRYDHEVKASTIVKPYTGDHEVGFHAPTDAGVVWLYPHGGDKNNAISISCGLSPKVSRLDAYDMAINAVDEAVRNSICVGANPDELVLVDNYCWPDPIKSEKNPDGEYKLAQLVRASKAIYDISTVYGMPFVSGKDSMKNDFIFNNTKISVPPTLLITAMGRVENLNYVKTSEVKKSGELLYLVGNDYKSFKSAIHLNEEVEGISIDYPIPTINLENQLKIYKALHLAIKENCIATMHDVSEGGVLTALAEMMMSTKLGIKISIDLKGNDLFPFFFNEGLGRIIVGVNATSKDKFEKMMSKYPLQLLGNVINENQFEVINNNLEVLKLSASECLTHYRVKVEGI